MTMTPTPTEPGAKHLLLRYIDLFAAEDAEGILRLFDDHALLEIPLMPRRAYGAAALRDAVTQIVDLVTEVKITIHAVVGDGDIALADGHLTATSTGELPDLDFGFGIVVESRAGQITRLTEYFDTDPILPLEN